MNQPIGQSLLIEPGQRLLGCRGSQPETVHLYLRSNELQYLPRWDFGLLGSATTW